MFSFRDSLALLVCAPCLAQALDEDAPACAFGDSLLPVVPAPARATQTFTHGDPSVHEQYLLELVNRARANPAAEAARFGIDLNQGLAPGTISADPKPPLAFHPLLIAAARAHSQWMLTTGTFSHTGVNGSSPGERMSAAGYPFGGTWGWGENIAYRSTSGSVPLTEFTALMHEGWFKSSGHRTNLLNASFDEFGAGLVTGRYEGLNTLMGTQTFALSGTTPGPLLTGVVYRDTNANGVYDPGEGVAGVRVTPSSGDYDAVTASAGGYAVPYSGTGDLSAQFSGAPVGTTLSRAFTGTGKNVKLDLVLAAVADTVALAAAVSGPGRVTSDPAGLVCPATCTAAFTRDATVRVTAMPHTGAYFDGWSGACSGTASVCTVTLTGEQNVLAQFVAFTRDTAWQVAEIYMATLGYAPDNEGLQYWIGEIMAGKGWTPLTVAQSFFDQPLVQEMYPPAAGYEALIEALYQNLFGRAADAEGQAYWLSELNTGKVKRNQMIIALINGGWDNAAAAPDMARFGNRIQVSLAFAAEQAKRGIRYSRLTAAQQTRLRQLGAQVLAHVTADRATRDAAIANIPSLLNTL